MATVFLYIEEIPGEAKAKDFEDTMELMSFSWGASQTYSVLQTGGSAQCHLQDLSCTKTVDKASPLLQKACFEGTTLPTAELYVTKMINNAPVDNMKYVMSDVVVSSYQVGGGGDSTVESFSLNFGKVVVEYTPVDSKGKKGGAVSGSWNAVTQTPE